jgi:hypothetical protein
MLHHITSYYKLQMRTRTHTTDKLSKSIHPQNLHFVRDDARNGTGEQRSCSGRGKARGHLLPAKPTLHELILPKHGMDPFNHCTTTTNTARLGAARRLDKIGGAR